MGISVYGDETVFGLENEFVGVGLLVTPDAVSSELIERALSGLAEDPDRARSDRRKADQRTLDERWFHASDDSANAHSHLCAEINRGLTGSFHCEVFERKNRAKIESLLLETSTLAALPVLNNPAPVAYTFARRAGLTKSVLEGWHRRYEKRLAQAIYDQAFFPAFFPRCDFDVKASHENAGLQCCDFLLWATVRMLGGKKTWWDRLNVGARVSRNLGSRFPSGGANSGAWFGASLHFKLGQEDIMIPDLSGLPADPDRAVDWSSIVRFFVTAVRLVGYLDLHGCPEHVSHTISAWVFARGFTIDPGRRIAKGTERCSTDTGGRVSSL